MTLPPEYPPEYPEYKATLEVRQNAAHWALLAIAILLCTLWTAGSVGGAWYLAHRIDQDSRQGGVDD